MTKLSEVIAVFLDNFHYLNKDTKREPRWFEFWYKIEAVKKQITDIDLTNQIEQIANQLKVRLTQLDEESGHLNFDSYQGIFSVYIANSLADVREKRYFKGASQSIHYEEGGYYYLEHHWNPKSDGYFEKSIIKALSEVSKKYPDTQSLIKHMIRGIENSRVDPFMYLKESMKVEEHGKNRFQVLEHIDYLETFPRTWIENQIRW